MPNGLNTYAGITVTRPDPGKVTIRKGKENRSTVFAGYFTPASFSEKDALAAYTLGEYLDILFSDLIRERLGGVYSISVDAALSPLPLPGELSLGVSFYCDPSRVDELQQAIHAEVEKIALGVIDSDVFAKAKEAQVKAWEDNMQDNGYIASRYANFAVIFDLPLSRLHERGQSLRSVTPDELTAAAKQLTGRDPFVFVMNPE